MTPNGNLKLASLAQSVWNMTGSLWGQQDCKQGLQVPSFLNRYVAAVSFLFFVLLSFCLPPSQRFAAHFWDSARLLLHACTMYGPPLLAHWMQSPRQSIALLMCLFQFCLLSLLWGCLSRPPQMCNEPAVNNNCGNSVYFRVFFFFSLFTHGLHSFL